MADFCGFADVVVGRGSVFLRVGGFVVLMLIQEDAVWGFFVHVGCVAIWWGMVYHGVCGSGVQYLCMQN